MIRSKEPEIGSEFHRDRIEAGSGLKLPCNGHLGFSGRTAIETVLREISWVKKAVLPSYCCDSMIEPFRNKGIEIEFYPVDFRDEIQIEVTIPDDADVFLWCNYFGFYSKMPDMTNFICRGGIVIEDITHRLLSVNQYDPQSKYLVASVRKWEPINCGGYCASVDGELHYKPHTFPDSTFIEKKKAAMDLKKQYLQDHDEQKKKKYLSMFKETNNWLAENYSNLAIDEWSQEYLSRADIEGQRKRRIKNAQILYNGLQDRVQFLFPPDKMDCPLFVPILLNNRDVIRSALIANNIYCPAHWPKPKGCESNIYDMELSLVCDQRYNDESMDRIISILRELL